ncbi:MAG: ankyrin repeat domain-containing protein [Gammaproteobacteria bacterium]|nr:ankyrin repeat domain-containing protein [Gammaproteobacteria bacterium]MBU1602965.1 ankyrin repeat domain-containing protein [Gammaproteobacteria bacterium]MBU2434057.1 ankyrin repeat domain-containing protein [Gammaproteobacteria bacterium]MBU2448800.1 ankyrin repeat domain-containing protein [Gammaproteobacteria bacterium]
MSKETIIPRLGDLLRALIKAAGYRPFVVQTGQDKDLDDLANEDDERQSSRFDRLQSIEDSCTDALAKDCGHEWAETFRYAWFRTAEALQGLAQNLDVTPLGTAEGQRLISKHFTAPMLAGFLTLAASRRAAPDFEQWGTSPFKAWLAFASHYTKVPEEKLLTNLGNELDAAPRTIERWRSGEPVGKLAWPYAPKVATAIGKDASAPEIPLLSGWLLLACAYQSLPTELREAVKRNLSLRTQHPWGLEDTWRAISQASNHAGDIPLRRQVIPLLETIQMMFSTKGHDKKALQERLDQLLGLIERADPCLQSGYRHIHAWFAARNAAMLGKKESALNLYARAVSGGWWQAGQNQHLILNEALLYAVGVGDKDAANGYWDKTFMLGLNQRPMRPLDTQELRRIAFSFEQMFAPQKAKDRIPPPVEIRSTDDAFSLANKHLANPNQKTKYAEGRTRRTPLMVAIQEGTLDDVKQLLAAGGDPNDFIPESGEGPLSYAMRRACDRKDTLIMEYLLGQNLSQETVNRPASTKRETPLKIAIEMANAPAVTRLIELGADVEKGCDYLPSALCYAMVLLHGSLHRDDLTQEQAFFSGKTRADSYDAKEGAALDIDLAKRRRRLYDLKSASERNHQLFSAVLDYFIRPSADHRAVIQALLAGGANANRRYRVEAHHLAEWAPTLFAAQIGDLETFRMLVEHTENNRGDPDQTLMAPSHLERFDALWVAIDHGRHAIASYLMEREKRNGIP